MRLGHGHYIIDSGSYTYSHSDKKYNHYSQDWKFDYYKYSFKFVAGDTIFMEFDSANRILRFRKNRSAETFQLNIVAPVNDEYHASVNFSRYGGSVSLVDG